MAMKIDGDAAAFPVVWPGVTYEDGSGEIPIVESAGVTVRAHFSVLVMAGLRAGGVWRGHDGAYRRAWSSEEVAAQAVADADALIAVLNKEEVK